MANISNNKWIELQHKWWGVDYSIVRRCLKHTYNNRNSAQSLLCYISTGLCPSCPLGKTEDRGCLEDCNCLYKDSLKLEATAIYNEILSYTTIQCITADLCPVT